MKSSTFACKTACSRSMPPSRPTRKRFMAAASPSSTCPANGWPPADLEELQLLIMPSGYYLTDREAAALDAWIHAGGVLLTEAHLAGYSATSGRHSRVLPGAGLAASWGLREIESTSSYHLRLDERQVLHEALPDDVRKALEAFGTTGGEYYPIRLADDALVLGCTPLCRTGR